MSHNSLLTCLMEAPIYHIWGPILTDAPVVFTFTHLGKSQSESSRSLGRTGDKLLVNFLTEEFAHYDVTVITTDIFLFPRYSFWNVNGGTNLEKLDLSSRGSIKLIISKKKKKRKKGVTLYNILDLQIEMPS